MPQFPSPPGRGMLLKTLKQNLVAVTRTVGIYQRL
jgi:hypothetical protein